jgi:hypothetical protein
MQTKTKHEADQFVRAHAPSQCAKNTRRYSWRTWLGHVGVNSLGGRNYLRPAQGTIVQASDGLVLVKTGRAEFDVIDAELITGVAVGDKVGLVYYQPRRFDGKLADGSEDPAVGGIRSYMLTGAKTTLPARWEGRDEWARGPLLGPQISNACLQDLIKQLDGITVNDGARTLAGLIRDAGCTDIRYVDPADSDMVATPPAVIATLANAKVNGTLTIAYDRGRDTYTVSTRATTDEPEEIRENVTFDELADCLLDMVDDGTWNQVQVTVIKRGKLPTAA